MMSAVKAQMKILPQADDGRGWAQKPNWLEEVVNSPQKAVRRNRAAAAAEAGDYRLMQLGAYEEPANAAADWAELSTKFPELKNFHHRIEEAEAGGRRWHRLVVDGKSDMLVRSCRSLQAAGYECLLR